MLEYRADIEDNQAFRNRQNRGLFRYNCPLNEMRTN